MAMSAAEVEAMFAAAQRNGTFLGEAFMYRLHPLTQFVLQLLRDGKVGEVRLIKSSFGFAIPAFLPNHRLFAKELVLKNFPGHSPEQLLERMIELSLYTEENLR